VTLLAIGPMTNVAGFLAAHPGRIVSIAAMGGALGRGNATPDAELNIWADPAAAAAVCASGVPLTLAPLDLTRELHPPAGFAARLDPARPRAALAARLFARLGQPHEPATPHDLAAAGWLLWPNLFETRRGRIEVVADAGPAEGKTVFAEDPAGPHQVLTGLDRDRFWEAVADVLNGG
jgi:inosine-uridine nucleoside N-ribohydrolase